MNAVSYMDVKQALHDLRFRTLFPELSQEIDKFLAKPGCGSCGVPLIQRILNEHPERVEEYFPGRKVVRPEDEKKKLQQNHWTVINCHVNDLQKELRNLPHGRKQIAITRWEDQITVVVNDLMAVF